MSPRTLLLIICVLALLALPSLPLWANEGADSSGGGLGVVCFSDDTLPGKIRAHGGIIHDDYIPLITSVEAFDLHEARLPRGVESELIPEIIDIKPGESSRAYVNRIAERVRYTVPTMARQIDDSASLLSTRNTIMQPSGVKPVDDANELGLIPDNCVLATMAVHRALSTSYTLHIDSRLFNHPTNTKLSRGVLLLHEFVYMAARRRGQTDSSKTRTMVAALIMGNSQKTVFDVMKLAHELGFENREYAYSSYMELAEKIAEPLVRGYLSMVNRFQVPPTQSALGAANQLADEIEKKLMAAYETRAPWDDTYLATSSMSADARNIEDIKYAPDESKKQLDATLRTLIRALALKALTMNFELLPQMPGISQRDPDAAARAFTTQFVLGAVRMSVDHNSLLPVIP